MLHTLTQGEKGDIFTVGMTILLIASHRDRSGDMVTSFGRNVHVMWRYELREDDGSKLFRNVVNISRTHLTLRLNVNLGQRYLTTIIPTSLLQKLTWGIKLGSSDPTLYVFKNT